MYAIIATGGKQYKVAEGDVIRVEKLGAEAGETVTFDQVLAVSNDGLKVGEDVAAKFTFAFSGSLWGQEIVLQDGKGQGRGCTVDLWLANLIALYEAGVKAENICLSRLCSACRDDYFYSYRRDRQVTGRMAAAVLLPQKS